MTTLDLTPEQVKTLKLVFMMFSYNQINPEAKRELSLAIGELSLALRVATGELPAHEADHLLRLARG
jgi:hypothetical protein